MFNKNLKAIRLKQGLCQKQVADYLNISPQSVSKWEKGEALPSIEFLPKMAECLNCEINDFFIPAKESSYDLEMLKEFFDYMTAYMYEKTKKEEHLIPLIKKYPDILEVIRALGEDIKRYQTIKPKIIQGILGCSDEETKIFVRYFEKHEMIEKIDATDSYFVVKNSIDGLAILLRMMMRLCNYIENDNLRTTA